MGLLTELFGTCESLVERWRAEADEREARARNPEVVGVVEREREEAAVLALRRCADDLAAAIGAGG